MPLREDWRDALVIVAVTRLALHAAATAGAWLSPGTGAPNGAVIGIWRRWDADLYLKIAEHGYAGSDQWSEALFPGLPLAIRTLDRIGFTALGAGMLLALAGTVVATAYLIRMVADQRDRETGRRAALLFVLFPTAVFLVAPYSEPLFLAGAVAAFHHARKGQWAATGVGAAVAVAIRAAGLFLLVGLAVEAWRRRRRDGLSRPAMAIAAGLSPAVAYAAWLWSTRGSPWFFLTAQREGWARQLTAPWDAWRTTWHAATDPSQPTNFLFTWRLELVAAAVGIALVLVLVSRREWAYAAWIGVTMAALLTSTWYQSIPRILLTFFPLMILMAGWTGRSRLRFDLVLALSAVLAATGVVAFTRGAWIA